MGKSKRISKSRKVEVNTMPSSAENEQQHDPDDIFRLPQIRKYLPLGHTFTCMFLAMDLAFNKDDIKESQVHVNYKYNVLQKYLELKPDRPERHAIRNLLGVLAARLGRYEDAVKFFVYILTEDPTNINAIANATWLCDNFAKGELGCSTDVRDRLRGELVKANGIWNATKSDRQWRDIAARCTAEQAFSSTFQPFDDEQLDVGHYCTAHKLCEHALRMLENEDSDELEKQDYEFQDAIACLAIAKHHVFRNRLDCAGEYFQLSLRCFHGIAQNCANLHMRAESWRKIAETIEWLVSRNQNKMRQILQDLNMGHLTWPLCLKRALAVDPADPRSLACKAKMIRHISFNESLELLNQSIGIDRSHYNRSAFVTRGSLYLEKYKKQKNYSGQISEPNSPESALLEGAKADFEHALSLNETTKVASRLAQVCEIIDTHVRGFTLMGRGMAKALECHDKVTHCQNGSTPKVARADSGFRGYAAAPYEKSTPTPGYLKKNNESRRRHLDRSYQHRQRHSKKPSSRLMRPTSTSAKADDRSRLATNAEEWTVVRTSSRQADSSRANYLEEHGTRHDSGNRFQLLSDELALEE